MPLKLQSCLKKEQQEILDYYNLGYKVSIEQIKSIKNKEKTTEVIEQTEEKSRESTKVTISRSKLNKYSLKLYKSGNGEHNLPVIGEMEE